MGIFDNYVKKQAEAYENDMAANMTEEQIADMEKQGHDMSAVRRKKEANKIEFTEQRKATAVPTDLKKLESYCSVPRSVDSEFFKDVAGKAPFLGKEKWRQKFANAPIVYGAIVQANTDLWLPGEGEMLPAVFVFALDDAHIHDVKWLSDVAEKINEMKEADNVPADCRKFIDVLRDNQSQFCFPLGESLAAGADVWCATYTFEKQSVLPGKRLPEDGIVPFLLKAKPKKDFSVQFATIPGKYYQG